MKFLKNAMRFQVGRALRLRKSAVGLHPFSLRSLRLCAIIPFLSACAIVPRGPVVSHTIERFSGRADGLISREVFRDKTFTRGFYFFTDPSLSSINAWHTNQAALGGCSHFTAGGAGIVVDPNTAAIIGAAGTAAGNIIGAAAKSAVK